MVNFLKSSFKSGKFTKKKYYMKMSKCVTTRTNLNNKTCLNGPRIEKKTYQNGPRIENHTFKRAIFNVLTIICNMNFPFSGFLWLKWSIKCAIFFTDWTSQWTWSRRISSYLESIKDKVTKSQPYLLSTLGNCLFSYYTMDVK